MKDVTKTSFGLLIAYLLPGLALLYYLSVWIDSIRGILDKFKTADSSIGLFLIVVLLAILMGLLLNALRWIIYENIIFRGKKAKPDSFKKLNDESKIELFQVILDENFRYHQFYGCMSLIIPFLPFSIIIKSLPIRLDSLWIPVFLVIVIEIVVFLASKESFDRYVERRSHLLED